MINDNLLELDIGCAVQLDYKSGAILLLLMAVGFSFARHKGSTKNADSNTVILLS